ncbi:hypothetical protein M407DRAFT_244594 [Tulasnella calospora MUT 4182]|uniref:Uncharacterized protein n=1 Tax=Tulasnella calospora MUT 4182 TaxID=1051891 RepID=A0A0C3QD20_9AGAM|nr:hypothetical protein M407DRAFT_245092 [Tulasnella calospora MUT 4182]KIO24047.1 hypothetical protein M407DRAFT_244594 [Tulasnella calospora MUT 4182]
MVGRPYDTYVEGRLVFLMGAHIGRGGPLYNLIAYGPSESRETTTSCVFSSLPDPPPTKKPFITITITTPDSTELHFSFTPSS